jgi:5-oxoprolinase (ATP-hydrolysing)
MGTTVATNSLLTHTGTKFCLVITKGFRDLLYIGNQSRPNLFDISIKMPNILYENVIEVNERVIPFKNNAPFNSLNRIVESKNKEKYEILKELDLKQLEKDLIDLRDNKNIKNIAVVLAHSYIYQDHEIKIGDLAHKLGFENISLSHQLMPMVRLVPRGLTTCIDAYLTPCIKTYIKNFLAGFKNQNTNVLFMQSDGGLTSVNKY